MANDENCGRIIIKRLRRFFKRYVCRCFCELFCDDEVDDAYECDI